MGRTSRCLRGLFTKSTTTNYKPKWITSLLKSCKDINRIRAPTATTNNFLSVPNSSRNTISKGETHEPDGIVCLSVEDYSNAKSSDFDPSRLAAVRIQSVFRGYLARRALRALRALVRIQALVRGYIVRKRAVDQVRRMHAVIRAQARARAIRAPVPTSSYSSSRTTHSCVLDSATPEDYEYVSQVRKSTPDLIKRGFSARASTRRFDEGKINKIVEAERSARPFNKNLFYQTPQLPYQSEDLYLQYSNEIDRYSFYTADDIPPSHINSFRSISARRGHTESADVTESYLSSYPDYPNYMAYTKSSIAKMRSLSAPKQRTQLDRSSSQKCYSSYDYGSRRLSGSGAS